MWNFNLTSFVFNLLFNCLPFASTRLNFSAFNLADLLHLWFCEVSNWCPWRNHRNVSEIERCWLCFLTSWFCAPIVQISIDSKHDFALSSLHQAFFLLLTTHTKTVCSALAPKVYYNSKAFRVCFLTDFRNSTRDHFRSCVFFSFFCFRGNQRSGSLRELIVFVATGID